MIGRRAILALSLLCALAGWAFAAPNAMAIKGTTAFTCVEEPHPPENAVGFSDEHCTKEALGINVKFVHSEIIPNQTTQLKVINDETSKLVPTKLLFSVEKSEIELEAGSFESCLGHTAVRNQENLEKQMEAAIPEFCGEFSKVEVKKQEGCTIAGGKVMLINIAAEPREISKGKGVVINNGGKEEMYVEFEPFKGKPFASFTLEKCKNGALNKTYSVEGTAKANVTTELGKLDGPTLKFTTTQTGKTLKVNVGGGVKAEGKLEGTFTVRMETQSLEPTNPVVLTTTKN
jgi:hypothetical protein